MNKTITVKGIGRVSAAPDFIVISMGMESRDKNYETAMNKAGDSIAELNRALEGVGFEKDAIKTVSFNVHTEYEYENRKNGTSVRVFQGYAIHHDLKVEFDLDSERLTKTLSALGSSVAHPQLSVAFTVKDLSAVNEELLRSAAVNAKNKAELLCEASGVMLGDLVTIDYNWSNHFVYSNTRFDMEEECLSAPMAKCASIQLEPEDIDLSDTATFVWEIKKKKDGKAEELKRQE